MFDVEIDIAFGEYAQIVVIKKETGEKKVMHTRAYSNNIEQQSRQMAQSIVDEWKMQDINGHKTNKIIRYTLD